MYTYWCSSKINKQAQVKIKPQEIKLRETTLSRKRLTQMNDSANGVFRHQYHNEYA